VNSEHPFVKAADIYPLALSIGITIQGIGFAFAQAKGLDDFNTRGCTLISQFMLPGKSTPWGRGIRLPRL